MRSRQPPYIRRTNPPSLRLTMRDRHLLETIQAFDGIMSLKQIDRLFFSGKGGSWPRERLRVLYDNAYLNMPDADSVHRVPLGETIYYLDKQGAEMVAGLQGETRRDFSWRPKPRWSLIAHDLAVNDFRIAIMIAAMESPVLSLRRWIPESEFWSNPDTVEYKTASGEKRKRKIIPDGFFTIRRALEDRPGIFEDMAFLLEIDMGTEDNPRFARQKVRPGVAYMASPEYKERFGIDYGRWLVVTTSEHRLLNMKSQTEQAGGFGRFFFTIYDQVSAETVLTQPICHLAGSDEVVCIVPESP